MQHKETDPTGGYIIFRFAITEPLNLKVEGAAIQYYDEVLVDGVSQIKTAGLSMDFATGEHEVRWLLNTTIIYNNIIPQLKSSSNGASFTKSEIYVPSTITEIKSFGMRGVPAYQASAMYIYAKEPPVVTNPGIDLLYFNSYYGRYLYVPKGSGDAYKTADEWKQYASAIKEMD